LHEIITNNNVEKLLWLL